MVPDELLKFKGQPGFEYLDKFGNGTKQCSRCKEVKDKAYFCKNAAKSDGLNYICRECASRVHKARLQKNREHNAGKPKDPDYFKACSKCGITRNSFDFHRNSTREDGLDPQCRFCKKERGPRRSDPEYRRRLAEIKRRTEAITRANATNSGWFSPEEDFIVLEDTMTTYQKAIKLERTYSSVVNRKRVLKNKGILTVEDLEKSLD